VFQTQSDFSCQGCPGHVHWRCPLECGATHARNRTASPRRPEPRPPTRMKRAPGRALVEERLRLRHADSRRRIHLPLEGQGRVLHRNAALAQDRPGSLSALEARLHELLSYQTPEFLVLQVDAASQPYLDWCKRACASRSAWLQPRSSGILRLVRTMRWLLIACSSRSRRC